TDRASSLTSTRVARADLPSTSEELMPTLQQLRQVLVDERPDLVNVPTLEAVAALKPHRVEPELCLAVIPLDVHVRRFPAVTRVEEEPIGPDAKDGGHAT